ncbi:PBCV-specific basic adaptor domain-containing protein [Paramecium bursaria Chlorella virus MA1E]|nr:PBCV-specific basic adaptor domain-containing protein [Paramecium bursaria Chlorella virus MA1E]
MVARGQKKHFHICIMSTTPEREIAYPLSPYRSGQNESHDVPVLARPMKSMGIPEANKISNVKSSDITFTPSEFGKKIGGGNYGLAYAAKVTPALMEQIKIGLDNGGGKVFKELPKLGSFVVMKVAKQQPNQTDEKFFKSSTRENVVHKELSVGHCYKIPDASKGTCISEYVPNFYVSYIIGKRKRHMCITVMGFAGRMSLVEYSKDLQFSHWQSPQRGDSYAKFYVQLEKALCSLWLAGYVHLDLHRENIMVSKDGKVKIIDFGFALKLPDVYVKSIASGITKMIKERNPRSFADLWTKESVNGVRVVNYTNSVAQARDYGWYNPDYKVLQTFYNEVPVDQRSSIPKFRSEAWGVRSQPANGPTPSKYKSSTPVSRKSPTSVLRRSPTPSSRRSPTPSSRKEPTPKTPTPATVELNKVNAKGRRVFRDTKGRTFVKQDGKKVYVKKLFTPKKSGATLPESRASASSGSPGVNTGKVDAKNRKVFKNSKGRAHVKQDGKKVYVKKLFTPKKSGVTLPEGKSPAPAGSPVVNTGKVDAKKRKVFKNSKGRAHVRQDGKKVYVKKLFTPKAV